MLNAGLVSVRRMIGLTPKQAQPAPVAEPFPFRDHRTVAEVDAGERCGTCGFDAWMRCSYWACPRKRRA